MTRVFCLLALLALIVAGCDPGTSARKRMEGKAAPTWPALQAMTGPSGMMTVGMSLQMEGPQGAKKAAAAPAFNQLLDNLEKALSHSDNENNVHALKEGIRLTLKGFKDTLSKSGLEEVKAVGEPFDPCFHEAVSEMDDPKAKPGIVLTELQKGYTLNTRLIRPAMVVVSRRKATHKDDQEKNSERACDRL